MRKAFAFLAAAAGAAVMAGCSDKSPLKFSIDSITDTASSESYIEADLVGNKNSGCEPIQDKATVVVRLERPGSVGPSFDAWVKSVGIDYYYYDPYDGQLKGPVGLLVSRQSNLNARVPVNSTESFHVPMVSYHVKAWSQGTPCGGVPGYPGGRIVTRMVGRVTVSAEDETGKKLSAQGSILIYLYDYGPAPSTGSGCAGWPASMVLATFCP